MSYVCSVCGEEHEGLPALGYLAPLYWESLTDEQRGRGKCGADLCYTFDHHFFVRGSLLIPILDGPESHLAFGVWASLSEANFDRYVDAFEDPNRAELGEMFGWFSNELRVFPGSLNLKCQVIPQSPDTRPLVELENTDHPLSVAQREGITFARAQQIVHETL